MVANNKGFYIVDPDRKGAAPGKPKDAKDNESQKAYYTRKYMEIHATRRKKKGQKKGLSPEIPYNKADQFLTSPHISRYHHDYEQGLWNIIGKLSDGNICYQQLSFWNCL